jgi:hypothetical protein
MNVKKILLVGVVALLLFVMISSPQRAAGGVHDAMGWLKDAAQAIIDFIGKVFS